MRRLISLLITFILIAALAGCGAKTYSITTRSGDTYIAKGSPEYNVKSDTYTFTNNEGKEIVINKEDIEVIKEQ